MVKVFGSVYEPDAVDAVCTRAVDAYRSRTVRASGKIASVNTALVLWQLHFCMYLGSGWQ